MLVQLCPWGLGNDRQIAFSEGASHDKPPHGLTNEAAGEIDATWE